MTDMATISPANGTLTRSAETKYMRKANKAPARPTMMPETVIANSLYQVTR